MDQIKIGAFIAELRKEKNMTQEALGEKLGVTNKTVSRWENGHYLPDIEMLQLMSTEFEVSINELISGERLESDRYKEKAEENLCDVLQNSSFTVKDRSDFYRKKWKKEHIFEFIIGAFIWAAVVAFFVWQNENLYIIVAAAFLTAVILNVVFYNRMMGYVERHIYEKNKKE